MYLLSLKLGALCKQLLQNEAAGEALELLRNSKAEVWSSARVKRRAQPSLSVPVAAIMSSGKQQQRQSWPPRSGAEQLRPTLIENVAEQQYTNELKCSRFMQLWKGWDTGRGRGVFE